MIIQGEHYMEKSFIKVSIIDDDKSYRDSLKQIFQRDKRIKVYNEHESGFELIKSLNSPFQPDVCLVDIVLKDISGIECAKKIKIKYPDIYVVIMTAYPDPKTFNEAKKIGADYLEKGPRFEAFIDRIITTLSISKKEKLLSLQDEDSFKFEYLELNNEIELVKKRLSTLTDNQFIALLLKKRGKSEKEIAQMLNVTTGTAHTHITRALEKLKLPNLLDIVLSDDYVNEISKDKGWLNRFNNKLVNIFQK